MKRWFLCGCVCVYVFVVRASVYERSRKLVPVFEILQVQVQVIIASAEVAVVEQYSHSAAGGYGWFCSSSL